jgi:hypothetical protein
MRFIVYFNLSDCEASCGIASSSVHGLSESTVLGSASIMFLVLLSSLPKEQYIYSLTWNVNSLHHLRCIFNLCQYSVIFWEPE